MKKYSGMVAGKRVEVKGETLKEAMTAAGYMPMNSAQYINRLVGKLTDGRRFSFKNTPMSDYMQPSDETFKRRFPAKKEL
jgi:hypothetical protein